MVHSFTWIEEIVLIILNSTKNKEFIILWRNFITWATNSWEDISFLMIFDLKIFINTLILMIKLDFYNNINIFWFIFKPQYFMSDFIPYWPFLRPIKIKFVLNKAMTIIEKNQILFCWVLDLLIGLKLIVFFKKRIQGWMEFTLWLFGDLNFDVVLLFITGGGDTSIKNEMPFISCFVVNDVNLGLFRIEDKLRVLFKTDFFRVIFIKVKLVTFDLLLRYKRMMWRVWFLFMVEILFELVSL